MFSVKRFLSQTLIISIDLNCKPVFRCACAAVSCSPLAYSNVDNQNPHTELRLFPEIVDHECALT